MESRDREERFKPTWSEANFFDAEITPKKRLTVSIGKSDHNPPRYSVKVGHYGRSSEEVDWDDAAWFPFISPFVADQRGIAPVVDDSLPILSKLLLEAHSWIVADARVESARWVEERRVRDEAKAGFGKRETRHTGKTERKKAKRAGAGGRADGV